MKSIPQLFEEQVTKTPQRTALRDSSQELTFARLNTKANQFAHYLRSQGVERGSFVGVCMKRSLAAAIGMMAILKAGAAFVPMDSDESQDRLAEVARDAKLSFVIASPELRDFVGVPCLRMICLSEDSVESIREKRTNLHSNAAGDHVAYVIYTSGSTGKRKGVLLSHDSVTNGLSAPPFELGREDEICSWNTSFSFGFSITRLFLPLLCGIPLVVIPDNEAMDPDLFTATLERERVTAASLVTPLLMEILHGNPEWTARLQRIRLLTVAGAAMPPGLAAEFADIMPNSILVNSYGASEIGGAAVQWRFGAPLGAVRHSMPKFFPNTKTYILNDDLTPAMQGATGELYVSSAHLSPGYINRPELTAERFLPNPFNDGYGDRLYRTGDLGRSLPDGQLELLGRADNQVKIRGIRVDLGEVEAAIHGHDAIHDAVVTAEEKNSGLQLVAYLVPKAHRAIFIGDIRRHLRQLLPGHMMPAKYVVLEGMPMTDTGKIDRQALVGRESDLPPVEVEYAEPRNTVEEALVAIWAEVLGVERVGIHDDFLDLGGHSLMAVQVTSRLRNRFGLELSPYLLLELATVGKVAEQISRQKLQ